MAYDETVAGRVAAALDRLSPAPALEKRMFGGIAYMVRGNMCIGVSNDRLMVRVGQDAYEEALAQPHAQVMDFTGRPMRGYVYVTQKGFAADAELDVWVQRALDFVLTLPPK